MLGRSITWITVKSPPHLNHNRLHDIKFDRQLPSGTVPLDITQKLNHKHPSELFNISHKELKYLGIPFRIYHFNH